MLSSNDQYGAYINEDLMSSQESRGYVRTLLDREKIITTAIAIGIFGGLVGGPILSLADYYAPPERRFWTFIILEFIGFGCLILMIVWEKSRKGRKTKKPPTSGEWKY